MKLLSVVPANDNIHKYKAVFLQDNGRKLTTKFGAKGMMDYTLYSKQGGDIADKHRKMYLLRHKKTENWTDPTSAGALSRFLLWEYPSFRQAVEEYRKRFSL